MVQRTDVISELREVERDLESLRRAKAILMQRVEEMTPGRREIFLDWAVSQIIFNSLVVGTVRCEGLIEDYKNHLASVDVPDNVINFKEVIS